MNPNFPNQIPAIVNNGQLTQERMAAMSTMQTGWYGLPNQFFPSCYYSYPNVPNHQNPIMGVPIRPNPRLNPRGRSSSMTNLQTGGKITKNKTSSGRSTPQRKGSPYLLSDNHQNSNRTRVMSEPNLNQPFRYKVGEEPDLRQLLQGPNRTNIHLTKLVTESIQQQLPTGEDATEDNVQEQTYTAPTRRNPWGLQSYKQIIIEAIEKSKDKRLTLNDVYQYFVDTNPYFAERQGKESMDKWKNSVRHNLSLHKETFQRKQELDERTKKQNSFWCLCPPPVRNQVKQQQRSGLDVIYSGREYQSQNEWKSEYYTTEYYEEAPYEQQFTKSPCSTQVQPTTLIQSNQLSNEMPFMNESNPQFFARQQKISSQQFEQLFEQQQMCNITSPVVINTTGYSASPIPDPHPNNQNYDNAFDEIDFRPDEEHMLNQVGRTYSNQYESNIANFNPVVSNCRPICNDISLGIQKIELYQSDEMSPLANVDGDTKRTTTQTYDSGNGDGNVQEIIHDIDSNNTKVCINLDTIF